MQQTPTDQDDLFDDAPQSDEDTDVEVNFDDDEEEEDIDPGERFWENIEDDGENAGGDGQLDPENPPNWLKNGGTAIAASSELTQSPDGS